jgi:hypothetical protein
MLEGYGVTPRVLIGVRGAVSLGVVGRGVVVDVGDHERVATDDLARIGAAWRG